MFSILRSIISLGFRDYILILYVLFYMSGSTAGGSMYISMALFFLWFPLAFIKNKPFIYILRKDLKLKYLSIYLFYGFVCGLIGGTIEFSLKMLIEGLMLFSPIMIYDFYSLEKHRKKLNTILTICLLGWCYFAVKAIIFYSIFAGAARELASGSEAFGDIAIGGGYSFAYGSVFIALGGINLLIDLRIRKFIYFVFWLITILLCVVTIVQTNSTITTIAFFSGLVLCLLFRNPTDNPKLGVGISVQNTPKLIFAFIFLLIIMLSLKTIGAELVKYAHKSEIPIYQARLESLGYSLQGKGDDYTEDRTSLPLTAFLTFLENPILGVCYKHGNGYKPTADAGLGNHCEFIDALANYGFFIGFLFLLIYIKQAKEISRSKNMLSFAWMFALLIMGTFNPFRSFQSHFAVFFVLPALANLEIYNKLKKVDN